MAAKRIRYVNVVPHTKIKKEVTSENEDEDCVQCRLCSKSFANEIALQNHARMEHMAAFAGGDPSVWTEPPAKKSKRIRLNSTERIQQKTEDLISSMAPTSLMSLASEDVSYIIIKGEDGVITETKEVKRKVEKKPNEKEKLTIVRREKEVQPITGPFECLQPSSLVADGTCHQIFFSCCEYSIHFRDEHTRRRKGLRCQVCEKPLNGAGEEPLAPYSCEVCGMGFQINKQLSEHMATDHIKLKPFACKVCHKRFTQQGGVQQHMRMHTGDRPFSCRFCEKAFTQKSGLDQHLRIHTKVKPYRCVICSKMFAQSVHLKQHMRTHTNVSPFQCGICSKRFTQKSGLEQHNRVHTKEKPFRCLVCTKEFVQNSHLKQHMKMHLDGAKFQCQYCAARFKQSSHLNYHLKNHSTTSMTEEQRTEYEKLMSLITKDDDSDFKMEKKFVCVLDKDNDVQLVEIEVDQTGMQEEETEMEEETCEEETLEVEVPMEDTDVMQEQILAEQSIQEEQLEEGEEIYILSDEVPMEDTEMMQEQMLAEQSIQEGQLEEGEETYILSDVGSEVWSVKLVENDT